MSVPSNAVIESWRTTANFTSKEYFIVKASGDSDCALAGAGDKVVGVLTNNVADGSSTAKFVSLQVGGRVLVKCAGAITAGDYAMSDANGKAVAGTDGNNVFGQALETHADGDIGAFRFGPFYLETT